MPHLVSRPDFGPPSEQRATIGSAPDQRAPFAPVSPLLADVLGGRVLAWIGGLAVLLGIALFLAMAIAYGWIGAAARVSGAGGGCAGLLAAGAWLHARRGRTEAAVVLVGVATAGLFATLAVAGPVYHLLAAPLVVLAAMLTAATATALSIRWAGRAIGALGLLGGLVSPLALGIWDSRSALAILGVAAAATVAVAVRQRWNWLVLLVVPVCAVQWLGWLVHGHPMIEELFVLGWFGALGIGAGLLLRPRAEASALSPAAAAVLLLNATLVGAAGALVCAAAGRQGAEELWLAGLALAHVLPLGLSATRHPLPVALRRLLLAIAIVLVDGALALALPGPELTVVWGVAAVSFAWLSRAREPVPGPLLRGAIGAHVGLALVRVVLDTPPSALAAGGVSASALLALAALAASCLAAAQLAGPVRSNIGVVLNGLGLALLAYLSAQTLSGPALVAAWAGEAVTLGALGRRTGEEFAMRAGMAFLGLAALHGLVLDAPPFPVMSRIHDLGPAAAALAAVGGGAIGLARAARPGSRERLALGVCAGAVLLYLASAAIIGAVQPGADAAGWTVFGFEARQQGQVLVSVLWSVVALSGLLIGLRENRSLVRNLALAMLLMTVGKVFVYDLSTLTALYRVASFLALGAFCLIGAFAYQRLRPPPLPDLRELHPSQR